MTHEFTYQLKNGKMGWVLDSKPYFDPMASGRGVAHDVLEEMPNGGEQPHDEFIALGALLYGRGCDIHTHFQGIHTTPSELIAHELHVIFEHAFCEKEYALVEAIRTQPLIEYEVEESIKFALSLFSKSIKQPGWYRFAYPTNLALEWMVHVENWLRIGFRKAQQRFQPYMDRRDVSHMFSQIQNEVDKIGTANICDKLKINVEYEKRASTTTYLNMKSGVEVRTYLRPRN
jgi:hypothetical protein